MCTLAFEVYNSLLSYPYFLCILEGQMEVEESQPLQEQAHHEYVDQKLSL